MTFKRLLTPMLLMGVILMMGSVGYAQTAINCGLSFPTYGVAPNTVTLASTPRAESTALTVPIAAGAPGSVGNVNATPANGVPAAPGTLGFQFSPPYPGGGAIHVTCFNGGTVGTAVDPGVVALTISLGVPITDTTGAYPSANTNIRIINPTGDFATCPGAGAPCVNINLLSVAAGTITIGLSNAAFSTGINFAAGTTSSFDLAGVLVSTNGRTSPVSAGMTSTGGITVGPTPAGPGSTVGVANLQVIDSVLAGLADPTVPSTLPNLAPFNALCGVGPCPGGAAVLNSAGGVVKGFFALKIPENYPDVFRDATQYNGPNVTGVFPNSGSSDVEVQVQLNNLPSGLSVSNCSAVLTDAAGANVTAGAPVVNFTNLTSASPILTVNFGAPLDLVNLDVLWVLCGTVSAGTATLPLPSTSVSAQVTLAPTGTALSSTNGSLTTLTQGQIPRFAQLLQPATAVTVVSFPPTQTTLLIPFAFVGPGFNTGISIANTTADSFGATNGGAAPSSGTITFSLFNTNGTSKTFTTAAATASGATFTANLSDILTSAGFGTTFTGYVFVTANFTNAHGAATIYTTTNGAAALSTPVLVVATPNGQAVSSANPRSSPEPLDQ